MKKESMVKNLLRALLFVSGITLTTAKQCARFEFPTLDHEQLYAKDNSHVSVPFRLDTTSCSASGLFTISVTRDGNDVKFFDYCRLVHKDGVCGNSDSRCSCPDNQTLYHFNKIVDRNDSTTWNWGMHVQGELTGAAKIQFNIILEPASITSLSLSGRSDPPYNRNDSVEVSCSWENGNSPVTARLLDRHGVQMASSNRSGQIHYKFDAVGCQDAGLIRCEAPWASHNKTATLLVKCAPEFVGTPAQDEGESLKVGVRAHTRTIKACKMRRTHPHDAKSESPIDCAGTLTGTPPDLTLTVRLDNVRKEEEGQWRLELANDAGTGHVDFELTADPGAGHGHEDTNTDGTSSDSSAGVNVPLMGGVIVGVNVGTVIIVTIIVLIIVRRSRRERQPEPVEEQEMVPPPIPPPRQDPEANRLAELARRSVYDDIFADLPQGYNRQNHPLPPCPDQPPPRPPRY